MPVPSYVLDTNGVVRWINPAAERLLGNVRGRHFTSVVGAEDQGRARELFARKVLGTTEATEASGVLVSTDGSRLTLEVSAVPLMDGERVVGVFGLLAGPLVEEASSPPRAPHAPAGRGSATARTGTFDEADRPGAAPEHGDGQEPHPHLLRALGVHTRLEAVAAVRNSRAPDTAG
jgi:PAS domain S-box-containing protein